ncbi:hypothetical protein JY420_03430 [Stenotrophomonas maltophilia]|nr:hypothetical protein [Stenotrophomonas maltophilia]MBN5133230.1 hypothetical protein [Stenotrophomonas maltophilia]
MTTPIADQLLTVNPIRAVVNAKFIASPGVSVLDGRFQCELDCGHIVIRPGEHVRGTRFSIRAPHSAACNQCKKEPAHD